MATQKYEIAKDVQNWDDARKIIFDKIFEILQSDKYRISTYEIMGYMYLSTRLILRYNDCFQIFEFNYYDADCKTPNIVQMEKFFTEDFTSEQRMENNKDFSDRYKRDQPEIK